MGLWALSTAQEVIHLQYFCFSCSSCDNEGKLLLIKFHMITSTPSGANSSGVCGVIWYMIAPTPSGVNSSGVCGVIWYMYRNISLTRTMIFL